MPNNNGHLPNGKRLSEGNGRNENSQGETDQGEKPLPCADLVPDKGKGSMRMADRAFREEWPVSPALRRKVIDKAELILDSVETTKPGYLLGACKVILQADAINVKREGHSVSRDNTLTLAFSEVIKARLGQLGTPALLDLSNALCSEPEPDTP